MTQEKFIIEADKSPDYPVAMLETIHAVKEMGGRATNDDIAKQILKNGNIDKKQQSYSQTGDKYRSKFEFALTISRSVLKRCGLLENPDTSVWELTDAGWKIQTLEELRALHKEDTKQRRKAPEKKPSKQKKQQKDSTNTGANLSVKDDEPNDLIIIDDDWKTPLLNVIGDIKPSAFELLCKRILSESGFFNVEVRGRSGDNGIDGIGFLRVNLVSFKVLFQCKRQKATVAPKSIRDFRGGALGNDAKGLFITTSSFSKNAQDEAIRDNTIAIDLIDGDMLCELLKKYNLGITADSNEQIIISPKWFDRFNIEPPKTKPKPKPKKRKK